MIKLIAYINDFIKYLLQITLIIYIINIIIINNILEILRQIVQFLFIFNQYSFIN
jgi:hypothetical protein